MQHNNSFVYDLFQAVYRSSLTCTNCQRQSNTFDPFLSVSLPIPQKTKRPIYVTVVYLDEQPRQVRIGLLMNQGDTVKELRQTLAADTKIQESQVKHNHKIKIIWAIHLLCKGYIACVTLERLKSLLLSCKKKLVGTKDLLK